MIKSFYSEPVIAPSLLVLIRKRLDLGVFETLTDELITRGEKLRLFKTGKKGSHPKKEPDDTDTGSPNN